MDPQQNLPTLLALAWLLPLASFTLILFFGPRMGKAGYLASWVATAAIGSSCLLSLFALFFVWPQLGFVQPGHHDGGAAHASAEHGVASGTSESGHVDTEQEHATTAHADGAHSEANHKAANHKAGDHAEVAVGQPRYYAGEWYTLGEFGSLKVTIGYYIDALTVLMFTMVTFIATCIHFYAIGYMHDELHDVTDHEVKLSDGHHLHRKGRFHRFFQYLSLFCFSMLGIVISGNIAMVFVFWELVGICSYFLIGFYIERQSASTAANKAFIVNRVGDFGMIIGLMALISTVGTFAFGDTKDDQGNIVARGIFSQVRSEQNETPYAIAVPDGMVKAAARDEVLRIVMDHHNDMASARSEIAARVPEWRAEGYGYWLLVIAGLGIFCGCVGKSAQFPLHTWLPDAMEGPTPVSALVHSATMVAAGVYLVGRFYPVFVPEVLLVIAVIGGITLFLAATIAITATDIKRVLAYSTVSQLGYMMLALGIGGWVAGMFHLITHAFFKSLLFMCSGSVIHACHTNELTQMGGLRKKMPYTAYTMLVGCMAIAGFGIPFVIGLSGYYSKDAIIAHAMAFKYGNPLWSALFYVAAAGAAITAFYMFRLWFMTFSGEPRDHHIYDHAHESPKVMYLPLVALAVLAIGVGWSTQELHLTTTDYGVRALLEQARPAGTLISAHGVLMDDLKFVNEHESHAYHVWATLVASATAFGGFLLAVAFYGLKVLDPREVANQFKPIYTLLRNKWYFDELYDAVFVQPTMFVARRIAEFDKRVIDRFIDSLARGVRVISLVDDLIDRYLVDGVVNWFARTTFSTGVAMKAVQTGRLRQYVMFIVVATVALFVAVSFYFDFSGRPITRL